MTSKTKALNIKYRRALLARMIGNLRDFRILAQDGKGQRAVTNQRYMLTSWGMGQPGLCRIVAGGSA